MIPSKQHLLNLVYLALSERRGVDKRTIETLYDYGLVGESQLKRFYTRLTYPQRRKQLQVNGIDCKGCRSNKEIRLSIADEIDVKDSQIINWIYGGQEKCFIIQSI